MKARIALPSALALAACTHTERPFPLQDPFSKDDDMRSVTVPCHVEPTAKDRDHVTCAPATYVSPEFWDEGDALLFRPLSHTLGIVTSNESLNVNSLDDVPNSAWFEHRIDSRAMSLAELRLGGCEPSHVLAPESAPAGSWIIDKGKTLGSSPGFRILVPGQGRYLLKFDDPRQPELASAATVVGAAAYHAVGYNTSCEQVVYFEPGVLSLTPGLTYKFGDFADEKPLDRAELDRILRAAPHRGGKVRAVASAWLPGRLIGPFRYEGTRSDDPNDVVAHEDRRELRANRVLAAWVGHVDTRETNSMDSWFADDATRPDSSPGHVLHSYLDWGDCLGGVWPNPEVDRRMGYSYLVDWGFMASDFVLLGIPHRPWDDARVAGRELFGGFDVEHFVPDAWKNSYPNPAFVRMTERDAAWMARILARFTPPMVRTLAEMADFTTVRDTDYLESVLEGRLRKILERYLTHLSPIAALHLEGIDRLCGVDLAEWRALREEGAFQYTARTLGGGWREIERRPGARICVTLPAHVPDDVKAGDAATRYVRVRIEDGVAKGSLIADLYDLGPTRGYRLVGIERPE